MCLHRDELERLRIAMFEQINPDPVDASEANVHAAQRHLKASRNLSEHIAHCSECQREPAE